MFDQRTLTRPRRIARQAWPVALLLWGLPIAAELLLVDRYSAPEALYAPLVMLPVLLAVAFTSYAIGGRRGAAVGLALLGLVAYWVWWFGWGLDDNISPFSFGLAADGLADAGIYHLALAIYLWPFLLVAVAVTWLAARWRGWPAWSAIGGAAAQASLCARGLRIHGVRPAFGCARRLTQAAAVTASGRAS